MNKDQAIAAIRRGCKVTHRYFTDEEWVACDGRNYIFEDGIICDPCMFWNDRDGAGWDDGWSIFGLDLANGPEKKSKKCKADEGDDSDYDYGLELPS